MMRARRTRAFARLIVVFTTSAVMVAALLFVRGGQLLPHVAAHSMAPHIACQPGKTCSPWRVVSSPNPSTANDALYTVAAISTTNVWAVGCQGGTESNGCLSSALPLAEHWNGAHWSVVATPGVGSTSQFADVAAVSASDIWAVGDSVSAGVTQPLIEHWNGATWSVATTPNDGSTDSSLTGVAVVSTTDVWAVGQIASPDLYQPLVEHWNGTSWSIVPCSGVSGDTNQLSAVAAISASDIWAVGNYYNGLANVTLTEHWNGTAWSVVSSPNVGTVSNGLFDVSAASTTDVWAVGLSSTQTPQNGVVYSPLIEHWNGSVWSVAASPTLNSNTSSLSSVVAITASDVWAVGYSVGGAASQSLVEHWNGRGWVVVNSPNVGQNNNVLDGVSAVSSRSVWAVGTEGVGPSGQYDNTLTEELSPFQIL